MTIAELIEKHEAVLMLETSERFRGHYKQFAIELLEMVKDDYKQAYSAEVQKNGSLWLPVEVDGVDFINKALEELRK